MTDCSRPSSSQFLIPILAFVLLTLPASVRGEDSPQSADGLGDLGAVPRFESDVRPIFKALCFQCHGEEPDPNGGLDVRLVRLMTVGGESGAAIVPGDAAASTLWQRIESDEMPEGPKKLSAAEKDLVRRWIEAGCQTNRPEPDRVEDAKYTPEELQHWAFQPVRRPAIPAVAGSQAGDHPIDAFIAAKLVEAGLEFSPLADRNVLIRRLSFDLTGLPPTPEELDAFLRDDSPDAYERLVDRLLASPQYGIRWGRHWLDVAGFSETDGNLNRDTPRPHAWRYRDYVIDAIQRDLPYDQFLIEQVAGDELVGEQPDPDDPEDVRRLAATGLMQMAPDLTGVENTLANRNQAIADTLSIVSSATVGLTIGCAQCHDHRYDPISIHDYYRYRAIFDPAFSLQAWKQPKNRLIDLTTAADRELSSQIEAQAKVLEAELNELKRGLADEVYARLLGEAAESERPAIEAALAKPKGERDEADQALLDRFPMLHPVNVIQQRLNLYEPARLAEFAGHQQAIDELRGTKPEPRMLMGVIEPPNAEVKSAVFFRGDPEQPTEEVAPGEIFVVARTREGSEIPARDDSLSTTGRRLAYARSLTDGQHPLVARVAVNRIWMHHFGRGLVATPSDFGLAGQPPSHPELLDWLAEEFVRGGWQQKRIHKLIVLTHTYRQVSTRTPELDAVDPDNRLLGRMSLRRLDAESVRDAMLVAGELMTGSLDGPSVPVGQETDGRAVIGLEQRRNSLPAGVADIGSQKYRRSVFIESKRFLPLSLLEAFDMPVMSPNCDARKSTNVAPQALLMLNDGSVIELAERIASLAVGSSDKPDEAESTDAETGGETDRMIDALFTRLFAVAADEEERQWCREFLDEQTQRLQVSGDAAWKKRLAEEPSAARTAAVATLVQSLIATNRFLYIE